MTAVDIGKRTFAAFGEDKAQRLASSISFSAIFSIAPLFIVFIAILGTFAGGHAKAQDQLLSFVRSSAGASAADTFRQIIAAAFAKPRQGLIAQIIGWVTFVLGASNLFASLQDALNSIWHVEATKGGWRQIARDRIASSGMILLIAVILLATFAGNAAVTYVTSHYGSNIPVVGSPVVLSIVAGLLTFLVTSLIFALIFKVLPDVEIAWKQAWFGGLITAILFTLGQAAIGFYFTKAGVTSAYGAAGSLLVALLWIYYSVMILLFGAEITKVTADRATLTAPSSIRENSTKPAGVDPRPSERPA